MSIFTPPKWDIAFSLACKAAFSPSMMGSESCFRFPSQQATHTPILPCDKQQSEIVRIPIDSLLTLLPICRSCPVCRVRLLVPKCVSRLTLVPVYGCAVYLHHPQQSHFKHLHRTPVRHCFQLVERSLLSIHAQTGTRVSQRMGSTSG